MHVYLVTLAKGLQGPSRMNGALFFGERALHFLCASLGVNERCELAAFGPVGAQLEHYKQSGVSPTVAEADVAALTSRITHSFSIPVQRIELVAREFCAGSRIVYGGGNKLVVWNPDSAGQFRAQVKAWAGSKAIKTSGL